MRVVPVFTFVIRVNTVVNKTPSIIKNSCSIALTITNETSIYKVIKYWKMVIYDYIELIIVINKILSVDAH